MAEEENRELLPQRYRVSVSQDEFWRLIAQ